mmetsp:Transcript_68588/g.223116  ORF Transcript_68588/g.223116 Transcript_68588/m.223116 type:complete len:209 (+) Transcript_68588:633-1259(+)
MEPNLEKCERIASSAPKPKRASLLTETTTFGSTWSRRLRCVATRSAQCRVLRLAGLRPWPWQDAPSKPVLSTSLVSVFGSGSMITGASASAQRPFVCPGPPQGCGGGACGAAGLGAGTAGGMVSGDTCFVSEAATPVIPSAGAGKAPKADIGSIMATGTGLSTSDPRLGPCLCAGEVAGAGDVPAGACPGAGARRKRPGKVSTPWTVA